MIPDAECLKIVHEILSQLDLGDFRIKVWLRVEDRHGACGRGLRLRVLSVSSSRSTTDASWTGCSQCVASQTTSSAPSAPQWTSWTRWSHSPVRLNHTRVDWHHRAECWSAWSSDHHWSHGFIRATGFTAVTHSAIVQSD